MKIGKMYFKIGKIKNADSAIDLSEYRNTANGNKSEGLGWKSRELIHQ